MSPKIAALDVSRLITYMKNAEILLRGTLLAKPFPGPVYRRITHAEFSKINTLENDEVGLSTKTNRLGNRKREMKARRGSHR
jgi:hypothetical protein